MTIELAGRTPRFYEQWWFRPLIGVTLLVLILIAAPLYGRVTSGGKISPEISRSAATVDVVVDLTTEAATFHREVLSDHGVFGGRDRNNIADRTRVRLQNVTQSDLDALTRLYWVEAIDPA